MDTTDDELLRELRRDPNGGLTRIFEAYAGRIRSQLLWRVGGLAYEDEVDTALSHAFMVLHKKRRAKIQNIERYVAQIAKRECLRLIGLRGYQAVSIHELEEFLPMPEVAEAERSEFAKFIEAKVCELSDLEEGVFRIDASEKRSAAWIARKLGTTEQTVYSYRNRRKEKMRTWLDEWSRKKGGKHDE